MILVLANYFRQTLSINESVVTLEQELSNVDNYLTLTKARFEDAIHVTSSVDPALLGIKLPPLILQPIVENAVRHGGRGVDDRQVSITVSAQEGGTRIQVADRGHGFPPEVLQALDDPDCKEYSGLFNVYRRLRSIYGGSCQFHVDSSPQGALVSFFIPTAPAQPKGEMQCALE
jgi:two-component system sensor histidine kinase LytS